MNLADKMIKDLMNKNKDECISSKDGKCTLHGDKCRECWKVGVKDE